MSRYLFFLIFLPTIAFSQTTMTAIKDVAVIDVEKGMVKRNQTIIIEGNRIKAIGTRLTIPKGAVHINAKGKYLMPGFWDMHFHMRDNIADGWEINEKVSLPLLLANGVTGVRYMAGNAGLLEQRNRVNAGQLMGPRMIVYSPMFTGRPSKHTRYHYVPDTVHARQSVDSLYSLGYDGIKVYTCFPDRAVFYAVADQANKRGMPFGGHVPATVTAAEAAMAGMRSMEHTHGVREAYASNEIELVAFNSDICITRRSLFNALDSITIQMANNYSEKAGNNLAKLFKEKNVYNVPTLFFLTYLELADKPDSIIKVDPLFSRYTPPSLKAILLEEHVPAEQAPVIVAALKKENLYNEKVINHLYRSGAPLLVGTDAPIFPMVPGFSVHQEMEHWVRIGLPTTGVLKAATINPAKFLGKEKELGSVKAGKLADLVLLDANPLENISNTKKIAAVFVNGKYLSRQALDKMLLQVEQIVKAN